MGESGPRKMLCIDISEENDPLVANEVIELPTPTACALRILTVINCIYEYLRLKDLKSCRLVNRDWNFVAEPLLRKRAKIIYRLHSNKTRSVDQFTQDFSSSTLNIPFTSFLLTGDNWSVSEFLKFFDIQKKNIRQLKIEEISILDENGEVLSPVDINPIIRDLPMLTKLGLSCCDWGEVSTFWLNLENVRCVTDLSLYDCYVNISDLSSRINPKRISLSYVTIYETEDLYYPEYRINDAIDFSNADNISLSYLDRWREDATKATKLTFDISECGPNVESVDLWAITITNWSKSESKIRKLKVGDEMTLLEETKMEIKKLKLECSGTFIDLFLLPNTLEKLVLRRYDPVDLTISCSAPISLPNLKRLELGFVNNLVILSHFSTCVNLTEIEIERLDRKDCELKTEWLPKTLKKLTIIGQEKITGALSVETLIIYSCSLNRASNILKDVTAEILILHWDRKYEINDSIIQFIKRRKLPTFVGPFIWKEFKFEKSYLKDIVNRKSKYYCFENEKGRAISTKEFRILT